MFRRTTALRRKAVIRLSITDGRPHTTVIKKRVRVSGKIPKRR